MKRISLIFAWAAFPVTWLFIAYKGETFGYGRVLSNQAPQWVSGLEFLFAVICVYSIFVHLPSYLKKYQKNEGKLQVYYILSVLTLGAYAYLRFVLERMKSEPGETGQSH
jgi:hypothetical protein